jgi:hypothetical protein
MFRRIATAVSKTHRDLGVKFCDGFGVSTRSERSARRLDAARASAVIGIPRV